MPEAPATLPDKRGWIRLPEKAAGHKASFPWQSFKDLILRKHIYAWDSMSLASQTPMYCLYGINLCNPNIPGPRLKNRLELSLRGLHVALDIMGQKDN